ncbi:MAG: tetratricopeptide repeat protein, partial [Cyanobacteria bacterium P01_H01_bin.58]
MGLVVDITPPTFEEEVLEQSFQTPVLIDFYAQWCGPCQMLKPMLEKLAQEYDFVLAKVDIDQYPELAKIFQVEGVPDIKVAMQGQVRNGFVGMLTEPQLREFLTELNITSKFDEAISTLTSAKQAGDLAQVEQGYADLMERYPERLEIVLEAAQFKLDQGDRPGAEALLDRVDPHQRPFGAQSQAMRSLMTFQDVAANLSPATEAEQFYVAGAKAATEADYESALESFLALVKCDRRYREDAGRKAMLTLFTLLGDDHPLTQPYR